MIELQGVSKNFGRLQAVSDLSLSVPRGELFCFLGPNGAGKTTTIKMMCGLMRPAAGVIRIGGINLAEDPVAARRITGYIPDFPFLYDRLTITEFFEFTGDLYGLPRAEVAAEMERSFAEFGLLDYRRTMVKDLSHGFRQRLIYTVTLLHRPQVLFVDEPFVGLDPFTIRMIKDLLRARTRAGMTVFLTTHILALIEDLADRIGILVDGRLVALGTLPELAARANVGEGGLEDVFFSVTGE
jgi:ABC-2 type transport system ATP-binding protein